MVSPNDKGIIPPEEMIDHNNANFDQIEHVMTIFVAYNQANIQQGTPWDTWPEWELCLTAINPEVHFESEDPSGAFKAEREHWLAVMQYIHDSEHIEMDGHTITVRGQHGHTFRFDVCFQNDIWTHPGGMKEHEERVARSIGMRYITRPIPYVSPDYIEHSLGAMWVCPEHVPKYGGQQTYHTYDTECISSQDDDTFPAALHSLLQLCIEDTKIWAIAYESDLEAQKRADWLEENWPGGIPDQDWEYQ